METGIVFNIQRYSIQDGPGIRTTVFLKGCPLRCWWCHNPESQSTDPEISVVQERCASCGECWEACPQHEAPEQCTGPLMDRIDCVACGRCVTACMTQTRQLVGQVMGIDQVLAEVLKDRIFYDDSGGGVTVSGGEPLMQADFSRDLLDACRAEGIHTVLDTSGYASPEVLLSMAPRTDLFLYDLKIIDDALHRQSTGVSNVPILANLVALGRVHDNIWIRVPVVPGFNDDARHLDAIARLASTVPGVRQVNLLPYHPTGSHKKDRLGKVNGANWLVPPSTREMESAAERFRSVGLTVEIGG